MDASEIFGVKGLVAVITGGGSGLGLTMAKALEANGAAKVFIIGRRLATLEAAASQAKFNNIIPIQGDVKSKDDLERIASSIKDSIGYVNLVIANAGANGPFIHTVPRSPATGTISQVQSMLWSHDPEVYSNTFAVNVTATYFTCVAFTELLDAGNKKGNVSQSSQFVATSSAQALNKNPIAGFGYGTSKMAEITLTKELAVFLEPWEIRSNVIVPGFFRSEMTADIIDHNDQMFPNGKPPRILQPRGEVGNDECIAATILYLASKGGAFCNGSVMLLDGGRLLVNPSMY